MRWTRRGAKGRVRLVAAIAGLGLLSSLSAGAVSPSGAVAADGPRPVLRLTAATEQVTAYKYGRWVYVELGIYLVAGDDRVEVVTRRAPNYRTEPVTTINGVEAPAGLSGFGGLREFLRLRVTDRGGAAVADKTQAMCLNSGAVRARPDAPDTANFPDGCWTSPFMLGELQGLEAGWAAAARSGRSFNRLPLGRYTATASVTKAWRDAMGIESADATSTVDVRLVDGSGCEWCRQAAAERRLDRDREPDPRPRPPSGPDVVPGGDHLPDLRALPAWGINVSRDGRHLRFAADVWNAGPSPLVVDGFRRADEDVMDAHQYFYSADGSPAGSARVGTMEWDDRDGHTHWHFTDFARYRLLDADRHAVVRSKKEAFCLAATDAIDLTLPGAEYDPWNTDLHSACGDRGALAVREVLPVGHGDTYAQYRPGQAFRLRGLPNGVYYVEVTANPRANLAEPDTDNNTAYRRIRLGGQGADRTVEVFAKGLVTRR